MKFLGEIGIDLKLLIAQIINFGLLLWLLKRFLYKPIIKRIEDDEKQLNEVQAEKKELDEEKLQNQKELEKARLEAGRIISEAEGMGEKIKDKIRKEAEKEKEATIKQIHSRLKEIENDERK